MYKKEKFLYRGNSNQMESFLCVFGIDNIFLTISLQYKQYWYHFWLVIERSKIFVLASGTNKYNDFNPTTEQPSPCVLSLYLFISKSQNRMSRLSDPNKSILCTKTAHNAGFLVGLLVLSSRHKLGRILGEWKLIWAGFLSLDSNSMAVAAVVSPSAHLQTTVTHRSPRVPEFSKDEVADHCEIHSCWIIVCDKVYDVTNFTREV